jgi:hypothetical protein
MLINKLNCLGRTFTCLALILSVLCSYSFAIGLQEVDLEKKYADILGKWELDLSDAGMGDVPFECYIENGAIWIAPPYDPPFKLDFIEGEEWKFEYDGGDSIWIFEFMKDDNSKYHQCKAINEAQGINTTGKKIEG